MSDVQTTALGPTVTPLESFGPKYERGVCRFCGNKAHKHQATSCLPNGKCANAPSDAPEAPKVDAPRPTGDTIPPRVTIERPDPVGDKDTGTRPPPPPKAKVANAKDDAKAAKAADYKARILSELNPALVKGFAQVCAPVAPVNFYRETPSGIVYEHLGQVVALSDMKATVLARCAVEVESSPLGTMASTVAGPYVGILSIVGGILVLGWHGYQLAQLRATLLAQVAQDQGQVAPAPTTPAGPVADFVARPNGEVLTPQFQASDLAAG